MTRRRRPQRGFILMLVLIIGVAALAVAVGLVASTGKYGEAVQHSLGGDQAMILAQSGMERTEAWAARIAATDIDFDKALDPDLIVNGAGAGAASCDFSTNPAITLGSTTGAPAFTDGTVYADAAFMNGTQFRLVPYGGGAYLVHVEDNDDDGVIFGLFDTATGNSPGTKGAGAYCAEGGVISGANNFVRDRDRAIWVTSVGIYPGTDPLRATHRATMRKLVINPTVPVPPAMVIGGNISKGGSGLFQGQNSIGAIQVEGNITGTPTFCGTVQSNGATNSAASTGGCGSNTFVRQSSIPITVPAVPPARNATWWDWTTYCNIYVDPAIGMFYWDNSRPMCSTHIGNAPAPLGVFPLDALLLSSCWVPLVLNTGVLDAGLEVVANGACFDWQPGTATPTISGLFIDATTVVKPNWGLCPEVAALETHFNWDAPPGGPAVAPCSTCNGATTAFTYCPSGAHVFSSNLAAFPVVNILHVGNFTPASAGMGAVPTTQSPRTGWAMFGLFIEGDLNLSGSGTFFAGVGSKKGTYPSIVANNISDTGSGTFAAAGGVYVVGAWNQTGSGSSEVFGPIHVGGTLSKSGSGNFIWDYDADLIGAAVSTPPPPPIIQYPTNF